MEISFKEIIDSNRKMNQACLFIKKILGIDSTVPILREKLKKGIINI